MRGVVAELLAQLTDVDAQVVALGAVLRAPHLAQQQLLGEQLARVAHEQLEQRQLGAREVHRLAVARDAPAREVDLEVVDAHERRRGRSRAAPRRSVARTRASSSSVSNGLVT